MGFSVDSICKADVNLEWSERRLCPKIKKVRSPESGFIQARPLTPHLTFQHTETHSVDFDISFNLKRACGQVLVVVAETDLKLQA